MTTARRRSGRERRDVRDLALDGLGAAHRLRVLRRSRPRRSRPCHGPAGAEPGRPDAVGPRRSRCRAGAGGAVDGRLRVGRRVRARLAGGDRGPGGSADADHLDERRARTRAPRRAARQLALATSAGVEPLPRAAPVRRGRRRDVPRARRASSTELVDAGRPTRGSSTVVGSSGSGKSSVVRAGLVPRLRRRRRRRGHDGPRRRPARRAACGAARGGHGGGRRRRRRRRSAPSPTSPGGSDGWSSSSTSSRSAGRARRPDRRDAFLDVVASTIDDELGRRPVRRHGARRPARPPARAPDARPARRRRGRTCCRRSRRPSSTRRSCCRPRSRGDVRRRGRRRPGRRGGHPPGLAAAAAVHADRALRPTGRRSRSAARRSRRSAAWPARSAGGPRSVFRRARRRRGDATPVTLFARLVAPGQTRPTPAAGRCSSELSPGMRAVADRFVAGPAARDRPRSRHARADGRGRPRGAAHPVVAARRLGRRGPPLAGAAAAPLGSRPGPGTTAAGRDAELYRGARLEAAIEAIDVEGRDGRPTSSGRSSRPVGRPATPRSSPPGGPRGGSGADSTAVAVALVVALVGGAVAFVQRRAALEAADERRGRRTLRAQIEALVGRAESLRGTQRDTAALLAVEAYRLADTPRTRSALFGTFTDERAVPRRPPLRRATGARAGSCMPDGELGLPHRRTGRLRPYDLDTGALGDALPAVGDGDRFPVLAASPDGRLLASASRSDPRDGPTAVGVIDTATGSLAFDPLDRRRRRSTSAVFLPDGRLALAIGEEGRLLVDRRRDRRRGDRRSTGVDVPEDDVIWIARPSGRARADACCGGRPSVALAGEELLLGAGGRLAAGPRRRDTSAPPDARPSRRRRSQRCGPLGDGTAVTSGRLGMARIDLTTGTRVCGASPSGDAASTSLVDRERGRAVLRRPVRSARGARHHDRCGAPTARRPERQQRLPVVGRAREPSSSASATTSQWSRGGGSTAPVRSPTSSRPDGRPWDFNHTGDLLLLERGDPRRPATYQVGLVDTTDGTMTTTSRRPVRPGWAAADAAVRHLAGGAARSSSPTPSSARDGPRRRPVVGRSRRGARRH